MENTMTKKYIYPSEDIIRQKIAEGKYLKDIAKELGIEHRAFTSFCYRHNIKVNRLAKYPSKSIITCMVKQGLSWASIAKKYNINVWCFCRYCVKNNIPKLKKLHYPSFDIIMQKLNSGSTLKDIAEEYNIKPRTFYSYCKSLEIRTTYKEIKNNRYPSKEIVDSLVKSGLSHMEIAKKYNISKTTFYRYCVKINALDSNSTYKYPSVEEVNDKLLQGISLTEQAKLFHINRVNFISFFKNKVIKRNTKNKVHFKDVVDLIKDGVSCKEVSDLFGISKHTVKTLMYKYRGSESAKVNLERINFCKLYYEDDLSIKEIAQRCNWSERKLYRVFYKSGFTSKTKILNKKKELALSLYKDGNTKSEIMQQLNLTPTQWESVLQMKRREQYGLSDV